MDTDNQILLKFKKKELLFIRSLGWISLITGCLYFTGYTWRIYYYSYLGVDSSMIEYPFPEILIPNPRIFCFIIALLSWFASRTFYQLYANEVRKRRAQKMGITYPLDELANYSDKINSHPANTDKVKNRIFLLRLFYKHLLENNKTIKITDDNMREKLNHYLIDDKNYTSPHFLDYFKDIPEKMAKDFVKYSAILWSTEEKERFQIVGESIGAIPKPHIGRIGRKTLVVILFFAIASLIFINNFEYRLQVFYCLLGIATGILISKAYTWEDRAMFWNILYSGFCLLVVITALDGYMLANYNLKKLNFPAVEIRQNDGTIQDGMLLATFRESYIVLPLPIDSNSIGTKVRIHSHSVSSAKIIPLYQFLKKLNDGSIFKKSNEDINIPKEEPNNAQNSSVATPEANTAIRN